jgi:FkbM family methyltransferase
MLNLALQRPALQSSVSPYSLAPTPAEDARGANNGHVTGRYGFHTQTERNPWWQVDLEDVFVLRRVVLFNRPTEAARLKCFSILGSLDGEEFTTLFQKTDDRVFGSNGEPFDADIDGNPLTRFVRIQLDGYAPLHFDECQVFGEHCDPVKRSQMLQEERHADRQRKFIREGRQGHLAQVGGFSVFVDEASYDGAIADALDRGDYEGPERRLISQLVTHVDRIIDIGTGIGLAAMTAARIAGMESVLTFDGNPQIVGDARDNFARNDLEGIRSHVAILRNRASIKDPQEVVPFYISKQFWASRLGASTATWDITKEVQVPVLCLEDVIEAHRANVLVCDLEGGEVELLPDADLSAIRLIIMETHYWAVGELPTDDMMRRLIQNGFSVHLGFSHTQYIALRKHQPQ